MLCGLLLASCATRDPSSLAYGKRDVGIDDAFILPADRSVVGITQERASNAITQTIALSTNSGHSGENYFRVTFFGPVNSEGASENTLSYMPLTDARITRELRTELAGVPMVRSPYYVQNNYGPFSYATGKTSGGDSCIYAWQQIRSPAHTQNFFQNRGRIDLRLRLCETGASQEKLLASMYEFTVNSTIAASGWNPYGEPAGPSPDLGRAGSPLMAPAVHSNLSGPFPASDLNTDRLNVAVSNVDTAPSVRRAAPAPKRSPAAQQEPDYYPQATQPYATGIYQQAPAVTVPMPGNVQAPQQINAVPAPQGHTASAPSYPMPQPSVIQVPTAGQTVHVPSPTGATSMPANPTGITVPSPCRLATNSSSGTAGNSSTVCP